METEKNTAVQTTQQSVLRKWTVKILKIVGNILFAFIILLVIFLLFFAIRSKVIGGKPQIAGNYALVVLSGSMSPQIGTGSVVFVKPTDAGEIKKGDVITFTGFAGSDTLTTHRVVGISRKADGLEFITKGDANRVNDPNPISDRNLIGRVSFSIPYLGYLTVFSQTKYGLLAIIVIPGILLLFFECRSLYRNYSASKKDAKENLQKDDSAKAAGKE